MLPASSTSAGLGSTPATCSTAINIPESALALSEPHQWFETVIFAGVILSRHQEEPLRMGNGAFPFRPHLPAKFHWLAKMPNWCVNSGIAEDGMNRPLMKRRAVYIKPVLYTTDAVTISPR
jgi:hypothetical protein